MPNNTNHTVLADPKNIPWLANSSTIVTLPSEEMIDQATSTDDFREIIIDDNRCETTLSKSWAKTVPVYAVHGQEGLGGSSSDFNLTWDSSAKDDCTAPAEKSELFVNMGNVSTSKADWDKSLKEDKAYYIAVPNEQYKLSIKHFIYKFPDFLRDNKGDPVNEVDRKDNESYSDIRSILFENLTSNPGNSEGVKPYVPGCACTTSDGTEPADGNHAPNTDAKPYADINLAFTDAIVPGSEKTTEYPVSHEDLAQMSYCYCGDTKKSVFNFDKIKPITRFGSQNVSPVDIIQNQLDKLPNYITDGQYAVFYVDFSPVDARKCYDQVGFRYAFAFNLKDRPVKKDPSPSACQENPCFVAKHDDVRVFEREDSELQEDFGYNTAPKLYDVPQEIIKTYFSSSLEEDPNRKVQYPGKIHMQYDTEGKDITSKNVTDCLYLAGRKVDPTNKYRGEKKANLTYHFKSEQPMLGIKIKTSDNKRMIENNDQMWRYIETPYYTQEEILAESPLNTDNTYGLSTVSQTLAQEQCNNEDNVHLNINFDVHTKIAENNKSKFGTYQ
jgi:hypothetical protein